MSKRNKTVFIALILMILAVVGVFLSYDNQEGFTGSRVKKPDGPSRKAGKRREARRLLTDTWGFCVSSVARSSAWVSCCWLGF